MRQCLWRCRGTSPGSRAGYAGFSTIGGSQLATGSTLLVLTNCVTEAIPVVGVWQELVANLATGDVATASIQLPDATVEAPLADG